MFIPVKYHLLIYLWIDSNLKTTYCNRKTVPLIRKRSSLGLLYTFTCFFAFAFSLALLQTNLALFLVCFFNLLSPQTLCFHIVVQTVPKVAWVHHILPSLELIRIQINTMEIQSMKASIMKLIWCYPHLELARRCIHLMVWYTLLFLIILRRHMLLPLLWDI